ncbi:MAG: CDP-alcohol phosphatidyltransferase family protein [Gammaproteobacteria bacterium]|nr:CDP-alcohol phosphatidyltransferase family protein [Gammaproteobacteria bacterium]
MSKYDHHPLPALLDQRLAHLMMRPFAASALHPNLLTTLTLVLGLLTTLSFLYGDPVHANVGALCFMLAVFSDHLDGELARMSRKTSKFGHLYDFVVGGLNYTLLFSSIGLGLQASCGVWAPVLGVTAGLCNPVIMTLRVRMDNSFGLAATEHPSFGWFNLEDFIYVIGPVTWLFGVVYFFVPFALGTIAYLIWTVIEYRRWFGRAG